mgnify:CR=1 FL=1
MSTISKEIDAILNRLNTLEDVVDPKMSTTDMLKALSFNDDLTIADRLVMTIVYDLGQVTSDILIKLTCMSQQGTRRCVKKLLGMGYINKVKNGVYEKAITKIY